MRDAKLLAVDVGNTAIKFGMFAVRAADPLAKADRIGEPERVLRLETRALDYARLAEWIGPEPVAVRLISVCRSATERLLEWFRAHRPDCELYPLKRCDFPLQLDVEFPDRVGQDRLAGSVAANALRSPESAAIVVDAGSAITVDLISSSGVFLGGAILPGWQAMARSLAEGTDLLPHLTTLRFDSPPPPVGRSTEQAIASGLFWGTVGAVRELVDRMADGLVTSPELILAGGDMRTLGKLLEDGPRWRRVRCEPHLVLQGVVRSVLATPSPCSSDET